MNPIDQLELAAQALTVEPFPSDEDAPDWIGRLAHVSKLVNEYKRGLMAELPGPVKGDRYQIVESRSATRSYNTSALLAGFGEAGWAIQDLLRVDAVRLTWRWTELQRAVREAGVTMTVAERELEDLGDLDVPMVGEVWTTTQTVKGLGE